ncbi:MAG: SGNH/GDSL hydrolase family protein, partial [Acidimicrobiales bacterium]
ADRGPGLGPRLVQSQGQSRLLKATAGRALGVGLICFALWTLFDANQLYHSALAGPEGARRSAAVAVLRPIAAVANALHLSGLVNFGDWALGHSNGPAGTYTVPTLPPPVEPRGPNNVSPSGLAPHPHLRGPGLPIVPVGPAHPTSPPLVPLAAPTLAHPLTILDIGDSVGEDLGLGLGDILGSDRYVNVVQKGVEATGLARPDYYNWPVTLEEELRKYHPGAVVVMLGANDDQALNSNGRFEPLGSAAWLSAYRSRVALIMEEALVARAPVLWVGLPPMSGSNVSSAFARQVNAIFKTVAREHKGVTYVPSWDILANRKGGFTLYKVIGGSETQIRSADGVHLYPAGYDLLARSLVAPMERAWGVNLHVG